MPTVRILTPGDPGWDDARQAWNLAARRLGVPISDCAVLEGSVNGVQAAYAAGADLTGTRWKRDSLGILTESLLRHWRA